MHLSLIEIKPMVINNPFTFITKRPFAEDHCLNLLQEATVLFQYLLITYCPQNIVRQW